MKMKINVGNFKEKQMQARRATRSVRQKGRAMLRNLCAEQADDVDFARPKPADKGKAESFSQLERWIRSKAGQPWDLAYSQIAERFDPRTYHGQHVRRLLKPDTLTDQGGFNILVLDMVLDQDGTLRRKRNPNSPRPVKVEDLPQEQIDLFLRGRRVIRHGLKLFWGVPTFYDGRLPGGCRQASPLTAEESEFFLSLSKYQQHTCQPRPRSRQQF